jgi:UDP-N-acetylglucosamine 4,6-dehydratase/5-epimerase
MKILIIGGSGSLGNTLIKHYIDDNNLYIYSRDEEKHWRIALEYNNNNLNFIIGNINDPAKITQTLSRYNFDIIILAAAMKHVDKCETETNECLNTNLLGTQCVLNIIENNISILTNLKTVLFVSTDKACSPVNIYGMSKAISELLMIEKAKFIKSIKFVCIRYGNVLNSRGSIIPTLHKIGKDPKITNYKLTHKLMTRYIMTLQNCVDLIDYALQYGESGDIIVKIIDSCKIIDLLEIFSKYYNKPIINCGLRPGEKINEQLINETQSMKIIQMEEYIHIKPSYSEIISFDNITDYNSSLNIISNNILLDKLINLNLINNIDKLIDLNTSNHEYKKNIPFPHCVVESPLNNDFAQKLQDEIMSLEDDCWDRYENPFENKYTLRDKNSMPNTCNQIFNYMTSDYFVNQLSNLVGEQLFLDETKNWWGIHKYKHGDHLGIHCDAGFHPVQELKKHITLGIYLSKNWTEENLGHLELWEGSNINDDDLVLHRCIDKVLPSFNKMVIFSCNDYAWHGNPTPVNCSDDNTRIFLTLSYLSKTKHDDFKNIYKKAYFIETPDNPYDDETRNLRDMRSDYKLCSNIYNIDK